ncbi:serine/threonine-protein kinase [Mesorhizobium delmotii]|uniref:Serine/threonine kinase n=1 Tax=Mesorhizobium delmotii TaxID=1631247 RepID=A0A2P9AN27_9HYPH|nr:serine/threonine-protein kinase [Mesorhizobium delmotii]SJM32550.1 Serine/threonine kinase [Mesorhizobium delmotii]
MSADDKTRISPNVANTAVGTQLSGIYELDERIAFGGMGEVYRGHNIQTGDHVAIKIVLPEFARDQTILSLFRKEASILNHLSHDAVVRYHVFTIDPGIGRPYLAMEFVDGQSLFDIMRRGPMPTEDVRKLCHRLASGLSAVHQAGAIHRDLSPDNIILPGGRVERAKIIDFGIARSATVGGETLIGGKFAGKYNYVSPEQLGLYSGEVSEQSDIYSLGLVLAAALRGKPIDMGGSQFEIVEKRRTVPDLSEIDGDFRGIVEAMLQPDPQDRPISMADIAKVTRDDTDEETTPPTSITPRDRTGLPRAGRTAAPGPKLPSQRPAAPGEQRFVPHVRPALLSEPRPSPVAGPRAVLPKVPAKSAKSRSIVIAALAALAVASGAGIYLSGLMTPSTPTGSETKLSAPEASKPAPTDSVANSPSDEPAKAVPPERSQTEAAAPSAEKQAGAAADQKLEPTRPAEVLSPSEETSEPAASEETSEPAAAQETSEPAPAEALSPAENQADAEAQKLEPARPAEVLSPTEEASEPAASEETSEPAASEETPEPAAGEAQPPPAIQPDSVTSDSQQAVPPRVQVAPVAPADKVSPPPAVQPDVMEKPEQPASQQATTQVPDPAAGQAGDASAKGQQDDPAAGKQPDGPAITLNVPKPELELPPAIALDDAAQRVSWVREFNGGDCFYASLTSATETAVAIEGLGTEVQPFERMLSDFQARFHVEPDISVRLIEPAQCEVTNFLRFVDQTATDKPQLVLDRTTVPSGSPIGGTLVTRGGLISSVLLIDHRGMAFNLDGRILAQADKATFNFPIDLSAADKAAGKVVPQIIMVITGPQDIQAAAFSAPTPAALLLPRILEEIATTRSEFSATAKYFRLGG